MTKLTKDIYVKVKEYILTASGFYSLLFVAIYLVAWYQNAVHGTKFILKELVELYAFVQAQLTIKYGIDSGLNSKRGERPANNNKEV